MKKPELPELAMGGKVWMPCLLKRGLADSERNVIFDDIFGNQCCAITQTSFTEGSVIDGQTMSGRVAVRILRWDSRTCVVRMQDRQYLLTVEVPIWWSGAT